MTLTPPRIGDLAARSPAQWPLDKKSPGESNAARWNVADAPDKKPAVCRNPDGAAAWWTLAGPFLSWCVARGKPHARHAPASLQLEVSRFVIVARPAARSGRGEILFECPHRASCRSPSPTGQETKSRRTCAGGSSVHRRVPCRGFGVRREKAASMVALLACRSGVRTFGAACGCRASRACLLGALAAAPGSGAMLAHRLPVHP